MKILGFGDLVVDKIISIDKFPKKNEKAMIKSIEEYASGKCANVIAALSKLDFVASFIGKVGGDAEGSLLIENMLNYGVDTKNIILGNEKSGVRVIIKTEEKQKIVLENMGENYNVRLEEIDIIDDFDLAYFVLLKGSSLETQKSIARIIKESGSKIIVNTESLEKEYEDIIKLADIIFLDYNEFLRFHINEFEKIIKKFLKTASLFVIKNYNGIKGCIVFENGNKIEKHIFKNKIENIFNEFNASSAFDAGFIFGVAKNKDLKECVKLANIFIEECTKKQDPLSGIPNLSQLSFLLKEKELK